MQNFNIGMVISLGDLELAVDYINNRDVIKEEIKKVRTAPSSPADSKGEQSASAAIADAPIDNDVEHKEIVPEDVEVDDDNVEMDEEDIEIDGESIEIEVDEDIEIDEGTLFEDEEVEELVVQSKNEPQQAYGSNSVLSPLDLLNKKKNSDVAPNTSQKQEVKPKQNSSAIQQKPAVEHPQAAQQISKVAGSQAVDKSNHSVDRQIHAVDNKHASSSLKVAGQKADAGGMPKISMYSAMDEKALYKEIKKFLELRHVAKAPVDRKIVEAEFGADNVFKLIKKGYLVSVGRGITIGY